MIPPVGPPSMSPAFAAVAASYDAAVQASGTEVERDYLVAGHRLRLRSADPDLLRRLSRTLTHLEVKEVHEPELRIHVWDSESGSTPPPPLPDTADESAPGAFFYFHEGDVRAGYQLGLSGDARVLAVYPERPTPVLSVLHTRSANAWYWTADASRVPYWEEANSFRFLFDWWLRDLGIHQVHAGSVGTDEGGVLLVGKSGSGKSTASLSALQSNLLYAGDDYVAVAIEPQPWVHSLYSGGKLMADHVGRLPFLLPALSNQDRLDTEKAVVYVHEHWPEHMATGYPLRAVLVARIVPELKECRVRSAAALAGLAALAPSTVFQMHTHGEDSLARMRQLLEVVPTFVLELGTDISSVPDVVGDILLRLNQESSR
jgi:hypothetical protein